MFYYDKHKKKKKVIITEMVPCFCFGFAECDLINFCKLSQFRTPDPVLSLYL